VRVVSAVLVVLGMQGLEVEGGLEVLRVHYAASCAPCPRR